MIAVAKGFSGGVTPFGASLVTDDVAVEESGHHSGTFGGNAKECYVALRCIERIREEDLLDNATAMGDRLRSRLDDLESDSDLVHEVRGKGLVQGVEIRADGEPSEAVRDAILRRAFEEYDLLTEACGNPDYNTAFRLLLPLNVDADAIDRIADAVVKAVEDVERDRQ